MKNRSLLRVVCLCLLMEESLQVLCRASKQLDVRMIEIK